MEQETKLSNLEKRRNNFQRNKTICYLGMLYLGYSIIGQWNYAPWYFHGIMLAMFAAVFAISQRSKKYAEELTVEIEALREELGMNDPGYWDDLDDQEDDLEMLDDQEDAGETQQE